MREEGNPSAARCQTADGPSVSQPSFISLARAAVNLASRRKRFLHSALLQRDTLGLYYIAKARLRNRGILSSDSSSSDEDVASLGEPVVRDRSAAHAPLGDPPGQPSASTGAAKDGALRSTGPATGSSEQANGGAGPHKGAGPGRPRPLLRASSSRRVYHPASRVSGVIEEPFADATNADGNLVRPEPAKPAGARQAARADAAAVPAGAPPTSPAKQGSPGNAPSPCATSPTEGKPRAFPPVAHGGSAGIDAVSGAAGGKGGRPGRRRWGARIGGRTAVFTEGGMRATVEFLPGWSRPMSSASDGSSGWSDGEGARAPMPSASDDRGRSIGDRGVGHSNRAARRVAVGAAGNSNPTATALGPSTGAERQGAGGGGGEATGTTGAPAPITARAPHEGSTLRERIDRILRDSSSSDASNGSRAPSLESSLKRTVEGSSERGDRAMGHRHRRRVLPSHSIQGQTNGPSDVGCNVPGEANGVSTAVHGRSRDGVDWAAAPSGEVGVLAWGSGGGQDETPRVASTGEGWSGAAAQDGAAEGPLIPEALGPGGSPGRADGAHGRAPDDLGAVAAPRASPSAADEDAAAALLGEGGQHLASPLRAPGGKHGASGAHRVAGHSASLPATPAAARPGRGGRVATMSAAWESPRGVAGAKAHAHSRALVGRDGSGGVRRSVRRLESTWASGDGVGIPVTGEQGPQRRTVTGSASHGAGGRAWATLGPAASPSSSESSSDAFEEAALAALRERGRAHGFLVSPSGSKGDRGTPQRGQAVERWRRAAEASLVPQAPAGSPGAAPGPRRSPGSAVAGWVRAGQAPGGSGGPAAAGGGASKADSSGDELEVVMRTMARFAAEGSPAWKLAHGEEDRGSAREMGSAQRRLDFGSESPRPLPGSGSRVARASPSARPGFGWPGPRPASPGSGSYAARVRGADGVAMLTRGQGSGGVGSGVAAVTQAARGVAGPGAVAEAGSGGGVGAGSGEGLGWEGLGGKEPADLASLLALLEGEGSGSGSGTRAGGGAGGGAVGLPVFVGAEREGAAGGVPARNVTEGFEGCSLRPGSGKVAGSGAGDLGTVVSGDSALDKRVVDTGSGERVVGVGSGRDAGTGDADVGPESTGGRAVAKREGEVVGAGNMQGTGPEPGKQGHVSDHRVGVVQAGRGPELGDGTDRVGASESRQLLSLANGGHVDITGGSHVGVTGGSHVGVTGGSHVGVTGGAHMDSEELGSLGSTVPTNAVHGGSTDSVRLSLVGGTHVDSAAPAQPHEASSLAPAGAVKTTALGMASLSRPAGGSSALSEQAGGRGGPFRTPSVDRGVGGVSPGMGMGGGALSGLAVGAEAVAGQAVAARAVGVEVVGVETMMTGDAVAVGPVAAEAVVAGEVVVGEAVAGAEDVAGAEAAGADPNPGAHADQAPPGTVKGVAPDAGARMLGQPGSMLAVLLRLPSRAKGEGTRTRAVEEGAEGVERASIHVTGNGAAAAEGTTRPSPAPAAPPLPSRLASMVAARTGPNVSGALGTSSDHAAASGRATVTGEGPSADSAVPATAEARAAAGVPPAPPLPAGLMRHSGRAGGGGTEPGAPAPGGEGAYSSAVDGDKGLALVALGAQPSTDAQPPPAAPPDVASATTVHPAPPTSQATSNGPDSERSPGLAPPLPPHLQPGGAQKGDKPASPPVPPGLKPAPPPVPPSLKPSPPPPPVPPGLKPPPPPVPPGLKPSPAKAEDAAPARGTPPAPPKAPPPPLALARGKGGPMAPSPAAPRAQDADDEDGDPKTPNTAPDAPEVFLRDPRGLLSGVSRRTLHWEPVRPSELPKTFWALVQASPPPPGSAETPPGPDSASPAPAVSDSAVTLLFTKLSGEKPGGPQSSRSRRSLTPTGRRSRTSVADEDASGEGTSGDEGAATPRPRVCLLDMARARNVEIVLRRIKLSAREIVDAVAAMDSDELGPDVISRLMAAVPTLDELSLVKTWSTREGNDPSSLGLAERFFLECARVKRLAGKLRALEFKAGVMEASRSVMQACELVDAARSQVRASLEGGRLGRLLALVLQVGNSLNVRAQNKARGFKLATLLKLGDTRTFANAQVSLLHFLVAQAQVADASLLDAEEDMPALTRAARVVFAGTADELRRLEAGLRALEVEVESMSRDARDAASAAAAKGVPLAASETCVAEELADFQALAARVVREKLRAKFQSSVDGFLSLAEFLSEDPGSGPKMEAEQPARLFTVLHKFLHSIRTARLRDGHLVQQCLDAIASADEQLRRRLSEEESQN